MLSDFLIAKVTASSGAIEWGISQGGGNHDEVANSVAVGSDGSLYITGSGGSQPYTKGGTDILLLKMTAAGAKTYFKSFGSVLSEEG